MRFAQLSLSAWIALALMACTPARELRQFGGNTMGTTYRVSYVASREATPLYAKSVKDLLHAINQSVSTYIASSTISQINASTDTQLWHPIDEHFAKIFRRSRSVYVDTDGAFNPAVGPLVNAWGFGPVQRDTLPDDATVQALLKVVSFEAFELQDSPPSIRKKIADAQLDFGAIAKGYAVDAIAALLEQDHIQNYVVEIAGEVRARGERPDGTGWRIGIEKPAENALAAPVIDTVVVLKGNGMATSGNYRNYQSAEGRTVGHILNPKTGYPATNSLLSATVIAPDAMTADAYATALIVMGLEDATKFVEARKELSAYFIARDPQGDIVERRSSRFPQ